MERSTNRIVRLFHTLLGIVFMILKNAFHWTWTTTTDSRAVGNRRLAVRAQEHVHERRIATRLFRTNRFLLDRIRIVNANARYDTVLANLQLMITFWHNAHPLHREILNGEKQGAKIVSLNFHIV